MTHRILVDGAHAEQIRLVIADDEKILDFEVEAPGSEQMKGNFFVAEINRVEPSLQAAFLNYGATRNGFLAFGEIHPSYFQLPEDEKKELMTELEEIAARKRGSDDDSETPETKADDNSADADDMADEDAKALAKANAMADEQQAEADGVAPKGAKGKRPEKRKPPIHRRYRIEDVVKEGQKVLVQVVKEERGTKGAAMTTYYSLPGRYTVLMPNTISTGGISRKITDTAARNTLKDAVDSLKVPLGSALIVRTAGSGQDTKGIKEDYKNLNTLWTKIQKEAEKAEPGTCVHEEGNVVIRALRDIYTDEVEEITIAGRRVYRQVKDFAKALMPDVAKKIKEYKAPSNNPIFIEYEVEQELTELFQTRVSLPSGGYIIINPTEALVAVDVNSGRNTGERNLEETALKTNLEAADEVARQLRLRDLSGLIVVDFIDMEDRRNNRSLERAMKKALRRDRARVQCSPLSQFGLVEISRQRLRPSIVEATLERCPHCHGAGWMPSMAASALMILRNLEQEEVRGAADRIVITTQTELAIYLLNNKKDLIRELESKYKFQIMVRADDKIIAPDYTLELILVKADGSSTSKTVSVQLREDPEAAPEAKTSKSRRARRKSASASKAKPAAKAATDKADEQADAKEDKKADSKAKDNAKRKPSRAKGKSEEAAAKADDAKPAAKKADKALAKKAAAKAKVEETPAEPAKPKKLGRRPRRAKPVQQPDAPAESKADTKAKKPSAKGVDVTEVSAADADGKGLFQRLWSKSA